MSLLLLIVTVACKPTKEVVKNRTIENSKTDIKTETTDKGTVNSVDVKRLEVNRGAIIEESVKETTLSTPDSSGKQFPVKTTETKRIIKSGKNEVFENSTFTKENKNKQEASKDRSKLNIDSKTIVKKLNIYHFIGLGIAILLIIVVIVVIKKYLKIWRL